MDTEHDMEVYMAVGGSVVSISVLYIFQDQCTVISTFLYDNDSNACVPSAVRVIGSKGMYPSGHGWCLPG